MSSPQEPYAPDSPDAGLTPPSPPAPAAGGPAVGAGEHRTPPPYAQFAPPPPAGPPGQESAGKSRKGLYVVVGIAGAGLVLVAVGVVVLLNFAGGATSQAKGLAEDFTELVIAGAPNEAYDYLDPALQEQLPQEDFVAGIASLEMDDSCSPEYHSVSTATENGTKTADIAGLITCDNTSVELAYRFAGTDQLKMINIELQPAK